MENPPPPLQKTIGESEMLVKKHIELLGLKVKDEVSGFEGVVSTISFDLYGCIQVVITPPVNKDGEIKEGQWFDVSRLKILNNIPVIPVPDFEDGRAAEGKKGAAEKPAYNRQ